MTALLILIVFGIPYITTCALLEAIGCPIVLGLILGLAGPAAMLWLITVCCGDGKGKS